MPNILSPVLKPLGLDPSQGYDTAAAGAREAQQQANALSDLQWNRQMQGLGQAQGYTDQLQSLYNSMYSPGGGQMAAGGRGPQAPGIQAAGAMQTLQPPGGPHTPGANPFESHAFNHGQFGNAGDSGRGNLTNDLADFIPGVGTANRIANFAENPSLSTGGRAAASLVPGANLAYDAGKKLWNKVF